MGGEVAASGPPTRYWHRRVGGVDVISWQMPPDTDRGSHDRTEGQRDDTRIGHCAPRGPRRGDGADPEDDKACCGADTGGESL